MARTQTIVIHGGQIRFIHNDDLAHVFASEGIQETKRASHVEPTATGQWIADLSPVQGPVLGPFERRDVALAAEVTWLQKNNTPIPT